VFTLVGLILDRWQEYGLGERQRLFRIEASNDDRRTEHMMRFGAGNDLLSAQWQRWLLWSQRELRRQHFHQRLRYSLRATRSQNEVAYHAALFAPRRQLLFDLLELSPYCFQPSVHVSAAQLRILQNL
jgi:hypothetical protein